MAINDTLSAALSKIMNAEKIGKKDCAVKNSSKVIKRVLEVLNENEYIGKHTMAEDGKTLHVQLLGNINKCGSIKPRFSTMVTEFEKWEKRFLPAKGFGILILSTSKGIITHEQAKKMRIGGSLLAYCY